AVVGTNLVLTDNKGVAVQIALSAIDKNTTNSTLTLASGVLTLTDSAEGVVSADLNALAVEPWNNAADGTKATSNTQSIYQMGQVAVGVAVPSQRLDVANGNVRVRDINTAVGTATDKVVVADATGILKTVKSTMPKFFYMPSILIDVQNLNATYVLDLYAQYTSQFVNVPATQRNPTSQANIPYIATNTELDYYITYFDNLAIQVLSVSNDGKLTYKVVGNATRNSFVNIVFVIK
ncbi:hypothetical protein L1275_003214, partial [Flavobacterium sp. HSC-61S13]|nr:hypothetical protein [Flavobacterium sp. HSC-61S13]